MELRPTLSIPTIDLTYGEINIDFIRDITANEWLLFATACARGERIHFMHNASQAGWDFIFHSDGNIMTITDLCGDTLTVAAMECVDVFIEAACYTNAIPQNLTIDKLNRILVPPLSYVVLPSPADLMGSVI